MPEREREQRYEGCKVKPLEWENILAVIFSVALLGQGQFLRVLKQIVRTDKLNETTVKYASSMNSPQGTHIQSWCHTVRACFSC